MSNYLEIVYCYELDKIINGPESRIVYKLTSVSGRQLVRENIGVIY